VNLTPLSRSPSCGKMPNMANERQPLDYASPGTTGRYGWHPARIVALIAAIIFPFPLYVDWTLEFALEPPPPGNCYVLDPESRALLAVIMVTCAALWIIAVGHLIKVRFRLRDWKAPRQSQESL